MTTKASKCVNVGAGIVEKKQRHQSRGRWGICRYSITYFRKPFSIFLERSLRLTIFCCNLLEIQIDHLCPHCSRCVRALMNIVLGARPRHVCLRSLRGRETERAIERREGKLFLSNANYFSITAPSPVRTLKFTLLSDHVTQERNKQGLFQNAVIKKVRV